MTELVRSEWLKISTTRGWWAYLIVIVLLAGLSVAGEIGSADDPNRSTLDFQLSLVDSAGWAAVLAIILGITITTSEFRHGTITPTFLAAPRREQVIAAKALSSGLVSVLFAILAFVVVTAVALPWLSLIDAELQLGEGEVATRAAKALLLVVLWGVLGVAIGAVVHSQVAGLVGTLLWIFVGEGLLTVLFGLLDLDGATGYLPFRALDAADGTGGEDLLSYWPAVAVSLAWIALIGAAGTARTLRRDIT